MTIKLDAHLHSNLSYDNQAGPTIPQILNHANLLGLQALAITDHNTTFLSHEYTNLAVAYDLILISGAEVTCDDGHLIVLGMKEPVPEFSSVTDAAHYFEDTDTVTVAAHPFDPVYGMGNLLYDLPVDVIEINGRRSSAVNDQAKQAASYLELPVIGSSDAHRLDDMGTKLTLLSISDLSEQVVLDALLSADSKII